MEKRNLVYQAQIFKNELSSIIGDLNYSFDSLSKVEDFITKTVPTPGNPLHKSFFASDTEEKTFGYGCFAGEVIRRAIPYATWKIDTEIEFPLMYALTNSQGAVGFVINKAFKRIYEGDGDNVLHFAKVMVSNLLKEEEASIDYFDDEDSLIVKYSKSPLCMISNKIYSGELDIDDANYSNNNWIFTSNDEDLSLADKGAISYIFLEELKERFPALHSEILKKEGENRVRIVRENDGTYRYQKAHKDLFFDSSSMASFQGNMKLNPFQWYKMNTAKVLRITFYLVFSFILMVKSHWVFILVFITCLLYNIWYWFGAKSSFGGGNVSPGKVISINPDRIAVATDLTKMVGSYPVIKILETKLLKENKVIGKFIPTISIYHDNPHSYPFWSEFHPVPVSHGITDKNHFKYLMSKFSDEDFNDINNYLAQASTEEVGTYKVNVESSGWKDYGHVDINKGVSMEGPIKDQEATED